MKKTFRKTTLIAAFAAVCVVSAQAATNPYEALEGNISLKGLGAEGGTPFSDVKISAKLTDQLSGAPVTQPTIGAFGVTGKINKAAKVTNKEIIAALGLDPKGKKIRWGYAFAGGSRTFTPILQVYDNTGFRRTIPASLLTLDVAWARNYAGVYNGAATLTVATSTATSTAVTITEGKLNGLTEVSGKYLGYLDFAGVGKFTGDAKKQLSVSTTRISANDRPPTTP